MNLTPKLYDTIERKKKEQASFGDVELTRLVGQQYMPMAYYFGSPDVQKATKDGSVCHEWSAEKVMKGVNRYKDNKRKKIIRLRQKRKA